MKIEHCKNKLEISDAIKSLLKKSFLMKAKDKHIENYLVIQDNLATVNEYLEVLDFEAKIYRDMEVISLNYIGCDGNLPPIYKMSMNEMKIFTCLLIIFTDRVQNDLVSPDSVKANIKELRTQLADKDLKLIPNNKITTFQNALAVLTRYNLVEFIDKEMKDEYSEFRILPSVMFAKDDKRFLQMQNALTTVEDEAETEPELMTGKEELAWEK